MRTITLVTNKISVHRLNALHDKLYAKGIKLVVVLK